MSSQTQLNGASQIKSGSVTRGTLNTATTGSAVITKVIAGTGISLASTGVDEGTGDVTISASGAGGLSDAMSIASLRL